MNIDLRLIQMILAAYESLPYGEVNDPINIEGYPEDTVNLYQELLMDRQWIKAEKEEYINGRVVIFPERITLEGYEGLEKLRDDSIFNRILEQIKGHGAKAIEIGFDLLLIWLKQPTG